MAAVAESTEAFKQPRLPPSGPPAAKEEDGPVKPTEEVGRV